ncbi:hypothetical protein D3C86_1367170 [compost metagenome]
MRLVRQCGVQGDDLQNLLEERGVDVHWVDPPLGIDTAATSLPSLTNLAVSNRHPGHRPSGQGAGHRHSILKTLEFLGDAPLDSREVSCLCISFRTVLHLEER